MNYGEFIEKIAARARVNSDQAAVLSRATLETLAERLTGGEAGDLASQLPKPLQEPLRKKGENAQAFGLDEFISRVSQRSGWDTRRADEGMRAVLSTVREAVSGGEFRDVLGQLPKEFRDVTSLPEQDVLAVRDMASVPRQ